MTKAELSKEISERTGIMKETVTEVIEQFMAVTKEALAHGEPLFLRGFGSFTPKLRAEKRARDITRGTAVVIPAHSIPHFKPAPEFKEAVSKGGAR